MKSNRNPLLDPFSVGDIRLLCLCVPSAVLALLLVGLARFWFGQPLVDIDDVPSRPTGFRIDVNQAEWAELSQLPGVGETLAKRIVAHRQRHGPFTSVEQLDDVRGIGPKLLVGIRPWLQPLG